MNTTTYPSHEAIETVQSLIALNIDSANGFREAADHVLGGGLEQLFREAAQVRDQFSRELQDIVVQRGEKPSEDGTALGTLHRWWLSLKTLARPNDEFLILAEAERGEDVIKHKYEDALQRPLGSPLAEILTRQYQEIKRTHDRIRDLRDRLAEV